MSITSSSLLSRVDTVLCAFIIKAYRGRSSAGRAPALQAGCRRFESARLHVLLILLAEKKNADGQSLTARFLSDSIFYLKGTFAAR